MPRGRKNTLSIDEMIQAKQGELEAALGRVEELRAQVAELQAKRELLEKKAELMEALMNSNKTVEEIRAFLGGE